jgi:hypothetical protein
MTPARSSAQACPPVAGDEAGLGERATQRCAVG